jgi:hypothetical protein
VVAAVKQGFSDPDAWLGCWLCMYTRCSSANTCCFADRNLIFYNWCGDLVCDDINVLK